MDALLNERIRFSLPSSLVVSSLLFLETIGTVRSLEPTLFSQFESVLIALVKIRALRINVFNSQLFLKLTTN